MFSVWSFWEFNARCCVPRIIKKMVYEKSECLNNAAAKRTFKFLCNSSSYNNLEYLKYIYC